MTLKPYLEGTFVFEISSSLNLDYEHNCTGTDVYIHCTYILIHTLREKYIAHDYVLSCSKMYM